MTVVWWLPVESGTRSIGPGVFTRAALLSILLKWVSTSPDPAAHYRCEQTLCVLLLSGTGAATIKSIDHIHLQEISPSGISEGRDR